MNCHLRDISIKIKAKNRHKIAEVDCVWLTNWKYLVWLRVQLQIQTQNKISYIRNC